MVTSPNSPLANISKIERTIAVCSSLMPAQPVPGGRSYPKIRCPFLLNLLNWPSAQPVEPTARRPLDDLCPLKLGEGAQYGQHQLVLGVLFVVLAADSDLLAAIEQLANDDGLVCRFASDPVCGQKIDSVEQVGFRVLS